MLIFQRLNKKFYPSNIFPVWVNASTPQQNDKFLQYLEKANVTNFLRYTDISISAIKNLPFFSFLSAVP